MARRREAAEHGARVDAQEAIAARNQSSQTPAGPAITGRIKPGDQVMILTSPIAAHARPTTEARSIRVALPEARTVYDG
jgi:hypothetical protein